MRRSKSKSRLGLAARATRRMKIDAKRSYIERRAADAMNEWRYDRLCRMEDGR